MSFGKLLNLNQDNGMTQELEGFFDLQNETGDYKITIIVWEKVADRFIPLGAMESKN
jgi:hypothetical protein